MEIVPVQQCRSLDGWVPIEVPSSSQPGLRYTVLLNSWGGPRDAICECEGYNFRGKCSHQLKAWQQRCGWHELSGAEVQNDEQRTHKICPACGGPTMWVMEVVDG